MISIAGLTVKQKILMDTLWSMQDMRNVTAFVNSLPQRDKQDCLSMMAIATQESLEEDGVLAQFEEQACEAIDRCR